MQQLLSSFGSLRVSMAHRVVRLGVPRSRLWSWLLLFALAGACSTTSSSPVAEPPNAEALGGVHVPPVPKDAKIPDAPAQPKPRTNPDEPPSFEVPGGLAPTARGQYQVMVAGMRTLHRTLKRVESQLPLRCKMTRPHCRGQWRRSTETLAEVVEMLSADWLRCKGLQPIDQKAFLQRARAHYDFILARLDAIESGVVHHIAEEAWGERALETWADLMEDVDRDEVDPPRCDR